MRDLQRTLATLLLAGTALTLPAQQKLDLLSQNILKLARPHAAADIAAEVIKLAEK